MKPLPVLTSSLAQRMVQFVSFKRMQGYAYADGMDRLKRFDAFLVREQWHQALLQPAPMDRYRADVRGLHIDTQGKHLSPVRQFSLYLHALEPESAVLPANFLPRRCRTLRFCPMSPTQVAQLMAATSVLKSEKGIQAQCICFLIGLLYSTGLRIGEALALNLGDVDTKQSTLWVRRGKFRRERWVPLSPSTLEALNRWLALRSAYAGPHDGEPLLVGTWNKRLAREQTADAFGRLCAHCGIHGPPRPRLHDLRHNYACRCLALWRETQQDIHVLLPVLANAMGHVNFHATQLYLHPDAAGPQQAAEKFHTHIHSFLETSR